MTLIFALIVFLVTLFVCNPLLYSYSYDHGIPSVPKALHILIPIKHFYLHGTLIMYLVGTSDLSSYSGQGWFIVNNNILNAVADRFPKCLQVVIAFKIC